MVGQNKTKEAIDNIVQSGRLAPLTIFIGGCGSGRHVMTQYLVDRTGYSKVEMPDCKVDTVREMIEMAYKVTSDVIYIIYNADTMSVQSKNALLKVTEEPPNKAHFVLTLESSSNTLPTILSRAQVHTMQPYTIAQIRQYCNDNNVELADKYCMLCENPGEVNKLHSIGIEKFLGHVQKFFDGFAECSGSNVFKSGSVIALKDEEDKYPLKLFLRQFGELCLNSAVRSDDKQLINIYWKLFCITARTIDKLRVTSCNKTALYDVWLLDIRKVMLDWKYQ